MAFIRRMWGRGVGFFNRHYRMIMFVMAGAILVNLSEANENADASRVNAARALEAAQSASSRAGDAYDMAHKALDEAQNAHQAALRCRQW